MYPVQNRYGLGKNYRASPPPSQEHSHPWRTPTGVETRQAQSLEEIQPFLAVPFERKLRENLRLSQTWKYNDQEAPLHPTIVLHKGCDFTHRLGTPIFAAARGVALGSYHFTFLEDKFNRETKTRDMESGKRMGYGLGQFVLIWHPQMGVFTLYAHLQEINRQRIPYFLPEQDGEDWNPVVIMQSVAAMMASTNSQGYYPQWVNQGDPIGIMGVSGLSLEGDGESPGFIPDQELFPTWDPAGPHLHFEVFTRKDDGSGKNLRWDPWGIYDEAHAYRGVLESPTRGLFLPDPQTGWPKFAG
ncbi:MAG TPA: M23 family metallopeptidase [Patescibacteria group bacterium]